MKRISSTGFNNILHTAGLLVSMAGLLGILGWFIAGLGGVKLALMISAVLFFFTPALPAHAIMRAAGARPLHPRDIPELFHITRTLAGRAGLARQPALYYLPGRTLNAFAAGTREDPAICISQGLLDILDSREAAGIIGHEITHIKNNDMRVMALAGIFGRVTHMISLAGQVMAILFLPALITDTNPLPLIPLAVMVFAPFASLLMHLALSRTREFAADLGSAELTGHPHFLASALNKLEMIRRRHWTRLFLPGRLTPRHGFMSTHPPTKERIRRLLSLPEAPKIRQQPQPHRPRFHRPLGWIW